MATDYSVLWSEHLDDESFEPVSMLAAKFGMKNRLRLKPDALPTIIL